VGCQSKGAETPPAEPSSGSESSATTEPPKEDSAKKEVPASYKHAGYEYYGLSNEKSLNMELKRSGGTMSGGQEFKLEEVKEDGAYYLQQWTGDLAPNGNTRLRVDDKGIYGVEAQGNKIEPAQLEMPADPKPGFTWTSNSKIQLAGGSIDSTVSKIIGTKKIKVNGKDVEVLVVERTSKAKLPNTKNEIVDQTLKSVEYYQKGVGAVKVEVSVTGKGIPTNTFSMEAKP
jgi:hypothetical protein